MIIPYDIGNTTRSGQQDQFGVNICTSHPAGLLRGHLFRVEAAVQPLMGLHAGCDVVERDGPPEQGKLVLLTAMPALVFSEDYVSVLDLKHSNGSVIWQPATGKLPVLE